nr:hypothetical protein Hi04_10k_c5591_00008 [uncultured bacterium]
MKLELAPASVLRAAAWPLETLQAFGAPELLEARSEASFAVAHREALERERRALWERTALDDRFLRALLFASPSLFTRVRQAQGPRAPRNKRVRHLETALYCYLVRAATRTAPNGLWAGVVSADFSGDPAVRARPRELSFTPDLGVFAAAFSALAREAPYLDVALFRLNPSVMVEGDSVLFLARKDDGSVEVRALAATEALLAALERLREHPAATLGVLATNTGLSRGVLEQLLGLGFLVGGLGFPVCFSSPWEALEAAEAELCGEHRLALGRTVADLREHCAALAAKYDCASFEELQGGLHAAQDTVHAFLLAVGRPELSHDRPLRCDLRLPCELGLGKEFHGALTALLADYQAEWLHGASPFSRQRETRRNALYEALGRTPVPFGRALPEPSGAGEVWTLSERWAASFEVGLTQFSLAKTAEAGAWRQDAPWGCLLVRLRRSAAATGADRNAEAAVSAVLGVDDSPTRPYARYLDLLDHAESLRGWLGAALGAFERQHGISVRELGVPFEQNPNVLARPELGLSALEPWGTNGPSLSSATLSARGGGLVVEIPGSGPSLVLSLSVARRLHMDPLAAQLALTGFDESVAAGFRAAGLVHPDEAREPRYAPRLCLSNGVRLRARRTCLAGALRESLGDLRRERASPLWLGLAGRFGWTGGLTVTMDGAQPLWLDVSSPLGLEAVLEGSSPHAAMLVEEAVDTGFLELDGGTHLTDLAVPFIRGTHGFTGDQEVSSRRKVD